jgi:hypothetical protein
MKLHATDVDIIANVVHVASNLANESSDTQGIFLNVFADELNSLCETLYDLDQQIAFIRGELQEETMELLQKLGEVDDG